MEVQTQLLQQQQAILGYLSRKEMRDCGISAQNRWYRARSRPLHALPKEPYELKNLSYRDKIALVNAYALPWTEESAQDPGEVLRLFIGGKQPAPRRRLDECECWRVTLPAFVTGFTGLVAVLIYKFDAAKSR